MQVFRDFFQGDVPTVLAIGNFDGVHVGHRALLKATQEVARQLEAQAAVLSFEPHPAHVLKREPPRRLMSVSEKLKVLKDIGMDAVAMLRFDPVMSALTPYAFTHRFLMEMMCVRHVLVGDDFHFGARKSGSFETLVTLGRPLGFVAEAIAPVFHNGIRVSSSAVRKALWEGDVEAASALLGRPYRKEGRVIAGQQLGRTLGTPTANILWRDDKPPLLGVFAVKVQIKGDASPYSGVANLGFRSGAQATQKPLLEVFLFDFDGNLYGKRLTVDFLKQIRKEQAFTSLDDLKAQIAKDVLEAKAFFDHAQGHRI